LTPIALPDDSFFLQQVHHTVHLHNGLHPAEAVHVYSCAALQRPAAALAIQAAWRAHRHRATLRIARRVLERRAAVCLQRWWRMRLWRAHLSMLAAAAMLVDVTTDTLTPALCLTLLSARLIGLAQNRMAACMPGHRFLFSFDKATSGETLGVKGWG